MLGKDKGREATTAKRGWESRKRKKEYTLKAFLSPTRETTATMPFVVVPSDQSAAPLYQDKLFVGAKHTQIPEHPTLYNSPPLFFHNLLKCFGSKMRHFPGFFLPLCACFSSSDIFIVVHRKIRIYDDAASSLACSPPPITIASTWYVNLRSTIKGLGPISNACSVH